MFEEISVMNESSDRHVGSNFPSTVVYNGAAIDKFWRTQRPHALATIDLSNFLVYCEFTSTLLLSFV